MTSKLKWSGPVTYLTRRAHPAVPSDGLPKFEYGQPPVEANWLGMKPADV